MPPATDIAPDAPILSGTDPASPDSATPTIKGSAEAGSHVTVYRSGNCGAGTSVGGGSAEMLGGAGIPVSSSLTPSQVFSATARDASDNTSPCSSSIDYVLDQAPPATPTLSGTDPSSPNASTTPKLRAAPRRVTITAL